MLKSQCAVTALLLALAHTACAAPEAMMETDAGAGSAFTEPAASGKPGQVLTLTKTQSGVIDSDDFEDGNLDAGKWRKMQHKEIFPAERDGYLVIEGIPSENAKGWWHAGAMTQRTVNKGLPDLVMAVNYVLPNWSYSCTLNWKEFPIYEVHLCNDQPDRNHSIRISRMCPRPNATEALFGGLSSAQLPKKQINTKGVEMFVSYNDGKAQGFIVDKDGKVHAATEQSEVQIEDYKRMELKSVMAPPGVALHLKVDWAVLYPQPLDVPAQFQIEGFKATHLVLQLGQWKRKVPVKNGVVSVKLPAERLYPSAAGIKVMNGDTPVGTAIIAREKDLGGLYPGDTWVIGQ